MSRLPSPRSTRGLGSARSGRRHWIGQRTTALALVPLSLWFVAALLSLVGADHAEVVGWMRAPPAHTTAISLFVVALLHHAQLGIRVVVEDYVASESINIAFILGLELAAVTLGFAALYAILRVTFGGY